MIDTDSIIKADTSTLLPEEFSNKTVEITDGRMSYYTRERTRKSKNSIVFIPGAMETGQAFKNLASKFKGENVIIVELPGHGLSEGTGKSTIGDYVISVKEIIQKLQENKILSDSMTVIGHSMGGSIALELAKLNMAEIKNVVLISSSAIWDNMPPQMAQLVMDDSFVRNMVYSGFTTSATKADKEYMDKNYDRFFISDGNVRQLDTLATQSYNSVSSLCDIQIPVLVIGGDKDPAAILDHDVLTAKGIKNGYLDVLPNQGHNLIMEPSQAPFVAYSIENFLVYSQK